jgi:hypothetical protein
MDAVMADLFLDQGYLDLLVFRKHLETLFREPLTDSLEAIQDLRDFLCCDRKQWVGFGALTNAPGDSARMMMDGLGMTGEVDHPLVRYDLPATTPQNYACAEDVRPLGIDSAGALSFGYSARVALAPSTVGAVIFGLAGALDWERLLAAGVLQTIADYTSPIVWSKLQKLMGLSAIWPGVPG